MAVEGIVLLVVVAPRVVWDLGVQEVEVLATDPWDAPMIPIDILDK